MVASGVAINQAANQNKYILKTAEPIGRYASLCRRINTKLIVIQCYSVIIKRLDASNMRKTLLDVHYFGVLYAILLIQGKIHAEQNVSDDNVRLSVF